jgi:hypothetical protein
MPVFYERLDARIMLAASIELHLAPWHMPCMSRCMQKQHICPRGRNPPTHPPTHPPTCEESGQHAIDMDVLRLSMALVVASASLHACSMPDSAHEQTLLHAMLSLQPHSHVHPG